MSAINLAKKRGMQHWYENEGHWWRAFVERHGSRGVIVVEDTGIPHAVPYWQAVKEYVRNQPAQRSGT